MTRMWIAVQFIFALMITAPIPKLMAQATRKTGPTTVPEYTFKVIHSYPHDPQAFTQGIFYKDGFLYEGTGLNGRSSLRKVRLETGEVIQQVNVPERYFGEGIAVLGSKIFQLTWKSGTGFIYDVQDFRQTGTFSYQGEGWGLTTMGHDLLMSDGTAEIRVLDGATLKEKRRIKVHDGDASVTEINELEIVDGEIFANVWQTDRIARISPRTGKVLGWIDLAGILSPMYRRKADAVLNGIAYDPRGKRLFVTGKLWPNVFEIQPVPKKQ